MSEFEYYRNVALVVGKAFIVLKPCWDQLRWEPLELDMEVKCEDGA